MEYSYILLSIISLFQIQMYTNSVTNTLPKCHNLYPFNSVYFNLDISLIYQSLCSKLNFLGLFQLPIMSYQPSSLYFITVTVDATGYQRSILPS